MLKISVAYATAQKQLEIPLEVAANCTVIQAIKQSGLLAQFPEIKLIEATIGINGEKVPLDASLHQHDRIEIYQPLMIDPKLARRERAKKIL